jgi:hypothetical protein
MTAGINWEAYDQFLGHFSDVEIASMVGCNIQCVRDRRLLLNIDPCNSFHGKIDYSIIRPKFGTMSDANLAKWYHNKTGKKVSVSAIRNYRRAINRASSADACASADGSQKEENMKQKARSTGNPWTKTESEIQDSLKKTIATRKVVVNYQHKNIMKKIHVDVPNVDYNEPKFTEAIVVSIIKDMDIVWSYHETKLKKCPFCHESDLEVKKSLIPAWNDDKGKSFDFKTRCNKCGAVGPAGKSEEEAMSLWGFEEIA